MGDTISETLGFAEPKVIAPAADDSSANVRELESASPAGGTLVTELAGGPVTLGSGAERIVVRVSGDAYLGDAQFTVTVDGQQIGGVQTASAPHGIGQDQAFTVLGSFGTGPHEVAVTFLNDLYDGTPETDRNLYVDGVTYGAAAAPGSPFYSAGTQTFSLPTAGGGGATAGGQPAPETSGSSSQQLEAAPTSITVGADGALYIGELAGPFDSVGYSRVLRIANPGATASFGGQASGGVVETYASGLSRIESLAFDGQGNLYVLEFADVGPISGLIQDPASSPASRLIRVAPDGTRITISGPELGTGTYAVADKATGDIYVSRGGNAGLADGEVLRYSIAPATGKQVSVEVAASGLNNPCGMAFGPDGQLYVDEQGGSSYTGSITRIGVGAGGGQERVFTGIPSAVEYDANIGQDRAVFKGSSGFTIAPDGTAYIAAGGGLSVATAGALAEVGNYARGLLRIEGLFDGDPSEATITPTFDPVAYAAQYGPGVSTALSGGQSNLSDLVVGSDGKLYATDAARNVVYGFQENGSQASPDSTIALPNFDPSSGGYDPGGPRVLPAGEHGGSYAVSRLFSFGDRSSDDGGTYGVAAVAQVAGQPTPNAASVYYRGSYSDGPLWTENLERILGVQTDEDRNFAYVNATARAGIYNPFDQLRSLTGLTDFQGQIDAFQQAYGSFSARDLVTVGFGGNDVTFPSDVPPDEGIALSVQAITDGVERLAGLGARHFLIANVPDVELSPLFKTPGVLESIGAAPGVFTSQVGQFNTQLSAALDSLERYTGLDVHLLDVNKLFNSIVADPAAYGFNNVDQPVLALPPLQPGTPEVYNPAIMGQDPTVRHAALFLDPEFDPTELGQAIFAETARNTLMA